MEIVGGNTPSNYHFHRPGLDSWIWSQAGAWSEAGGSDLHLVSSCASGRITRLLLADVCGMGSVFADIASDFRELMKKNVNSVTQARFLRGMTHHLRSASEKGGFASAVVTTFFAPTRSLSVCNAGHPSPLFFSKSVGQWSALKLTPRDTPLGNAERGTVDESEYQRFRLKLDAGDIVLCYSNTLVECRADGGRVIGIDGLLNFIRTLDPSKPEKLIGQLLNWLQRSDSETLSSNDATILVCHGTESPVPWRDNLLAPLRLLSKVSDRSEIH